MKSNDHFPNISLSFSVIYWMTFQISAFLSYFTTIYYPDDNFYKYLWNSSLLSNFDNACLVSSSFLFSYSSFWILAGATGWSLQLLPLYSQQKMTASSASTTQYILLKKRQESFFMRLNCCHSPSCTNWREWLRAQLLMRTMVVSVSLSSVWGWTVRCWQLASAIWQQKTSRMKSKISLMRCFTTNVISLSINFMGEPKSIQS